MNTEWEGEGEEDDCTTCRFWLDAECTNARNENRPARHPDALTGVCPYWAELLIPDEHLGVGDLLTGIDEEEGRYW